MDDPLRYLDAGLLDGDGLRAELDPASIRAARRFVAEGLDASAVEHCAEALARVAEALGGEDSFALAPVVTLVTELGAPDALVALIERAGPTRPVELAALAVHVLDIAEHMALRIYGAELPWLLARSDRSGDAARNVGIARHLKG